MTNNFEAFEIYPKTMVYRNVFEDAKRIEQILKDSTTNDDDRILSKWSQWSIFGDYLNPTIPGNFPRGFNSESIAEIETQSKIQEDHKYFLQELHDGFHAVADDYISRFGNEFNFDRDEMTIDEDGHKLPRWQMYGPSICKYSEEWEHPMAMTYHSDYIRQPINSPGYKFAITVNAYFNDDYEGGEIDFYAGNELYSYKPKAGDWLIFPSGHPEVLTKDEKVYLHGVTAPTKGHKYFSRMYWRKYHNGDPLWFEKEKEFGKEEWASMQDAIMEKYRNEIPNRFEIPEGVRVNNEFNQSK